VYGAGSGALWLALAQCEREGEGKSQAAAAVGGAVDSRRTAGGAGQVYWQVRGLGATLERFAGGPLRARWGTR
jgi:hypothetical protein